MRVVSSSYVRPAIPTDTASKSYALTPLDRHICCAQPLKRIVFYKAPPASSAGPPPRWECVVQRLRDSLADALVLFYPLAGRLERREEDGQVEVRCEDSGVGFVEAVVDGATLEDLAMGELPEQELFYLAPGHEHSTALTVLQPWTSETPPLAVQVTRFACGGFSIGLACLHQIVDAPSVWHFLHSWSLMASGNAAQVVPPDYSHHLLRPDPAKHYTHLPPDYSLLSRAGAGGGMTAPDHKLQTKVCHFTADSVRDLKHQAIAAAAAGATTAPSCAFTAYEVAVGHMWQRVVAARRLPDSAETQVVLPMSVRTRLIPSSPSSSSSAREALVVNRFKNLPPTYFGNAVAFCVTRPVAAPELAAGDAAFCAGLVRDAKRTYDPDKLQRLINVSDGIDAGTVPLLSSLLLPHTFIVGDCHVTPAYEADFGWGTPQCIRYADLYNAPNVLMLVAGKEPGSLSFQVCDLGDHIASLEADGLFRGRPAVVRPRVRLVQAESSTPHVVDVVPPLTLLTPLDADETRVLQHNAS